MFHRRLGIALVATALVACGDGFAVGPSPAETTPTSVTTTTLPEGPQGGFGTPAKSLGEFENVDTPRPVRGELHLDSKGCWYVEFSSLRYLIAFPTGFEIPFSEDPTVVRAKDGTVFTSGTVVDGAARQVWFDHLPEGSDGRWGNYVSFCDPSERVLAVFEELAPASDPGMLEPDQLDTLVENAKFTKPWPCGYGWAVSTEDETIALFIYLQAETTDLAAGSQVGLPDERWTAWITAGKFLFVNHCDDVFEPWEPEPVIAGRWQLSGGRLQLLDGVGGEQSTGLVRAVLLGATINTDSGRQITFDRIELENRSFGFLAG